MRLIFSRDRAAQLDLLLRSLDRHAPEEDTYVIYTATGDAYRAGYGKAMSERQDVTWWDDRGRKFQELLETALVLPVRTVTFFCDDDVLFRPIDRAAERALCEPQLLTFSLRLGCSSCGEGTLAYIWDWTRLPPHDHGYPGSVDGHTFRTADVLRMIAGQTIPDPLQLETVLARRAGAVDRPLMACYPKQALVGLNVNSVAATGGNRQSGKEHPQPPAHLNRRFLEGERISLDALDFSKVDECLTETQFVWETP